MRNSLHSGARQRATEGTRADPPPGQRADAFESSSVPMSSELLGRADPPPLQPSEGYAEEQSIDVCQTGSAVAPDKQKRSEPDVSMTCSPPVPPVSAEEAKAITSSEEDLDLPPAAEHAYGAIRPNLRVGQDLMEGQTEDSETPGEHQLRSKLLLPHLSVRFHLAGHLGRGSNGHSHSALMKRNTGDSPQSPPDGPGAIRKTWKRLKAAGSATPGASAATAAGKRAARLGREAAKRSAMKATKAMRALKAVQGEIDSATRLQRMLGIQKYTEDDRLQQLAETETLLSPGECLQYDLKVLQYYTSTEKDIELRNRRAKAFIYTPAAQIFMAVIIILNTVFLGISTMEISSQTENSSSTQPPRDTELIKWNKVLFIFLTVCNAVFAIVFFMEMILRIKCDRGAYFRDIVNVTDFVNAWLGVVDLFIAALHYMEQVHVDVFQSIAAILRLVRLLRVLRFIRILKAFLPMRVLVDGMTASFFSLVYAVLFFIVLVYGVAVFFTTAFGTTQALHEYWGDLFTSMYTLFLILTMTNWDVVAAKTAIHYGWAKPVIVLYTVFSFFVLFNVVTAVIVEAFSSAAKRLQAEAMHFAMFEECQGDEKVFSRALTKTPLLNAVSGVSLDKRHADKPLFDAGYAYTYRDASGRGNGDIVESTKSTRRCAAVRAKELEKSEPDMRPGGFREDGDTKKQMRTEKVCVRTGEPASAATGFSFFHRGVFPPNSSSSDLEPVIEKPRPPRKFPSSLFASFVRPSSLIQHRDGPSLLRRISPQKRLRCVKGVLTTRSGNMCSQANHEDADNIEPKKLPVVSQAGKVQHSRTSGMEGAVASPLENDTIKGFPLTDEGNTSAVNSMLSTQGAEMTSTLRLGSADEETAAKAAGGAPATKEFFESAGVPHADRTREEALRGTTQIEAGPSSSHMGIGEGFDDFGNNCGRLYDEGLLASNSLKTYPRDPDAVLSIDLRRYSPLQVLGTRAVQLAMRKCGISYIQAYDCLNILIQKGFEEVTVPGFLTCCRRVVGHPSARQLFLLELDLDRAFRHLNAKVSRAVALLESVFGVEGLIAWPSALSGTRSGFFN